MKYFARTESADISITPHPSSAAARGIYSNGDTIQGDVLVNAQEAIQLKDISIAFVGRCTIASRARSRWAREALPTKTTHTFLMMQQSLERSNSSLTAPLKEGAALRIPFFFVVPSMLLPPACEHEHCAMQKDQQTCLPGHLNLPPSFSTGETEGVSINRADDTAKIEYMVLVRLKFTILENQTLQGLASHLPIIIEPCSACNASSTALSRSYFRDEHMVWPSLSLNQIDGRLNLYAACSTPVLSRSMTQTRSSVLTTVAVAMIFIPEQARSYLPQPHHVKVSLKTHTRTNLAGTTAPGTGDVCDNAETESRVCTKSMQLDEIPIVGLHWSEDQSMSSLSTSGSIESQWSNAPQCSDHVRRDMTDVGRPPDVYCKRYSAKVDIPVRVPARHHDRQSLQLVPTFESCIVARSYSLELKFVFRRSNKAVILSSETLSPGVSETTITAPSQSHRSKWLRNPWESKEAKLKVPVEVVAVSAAHLTSSHPSTSSRFNNTYPSCLSDHERLNFDTLTTEHSSCALGPPPSDGFQRLWHYQDVQMEDLPPYRPK